MGTLERYMECNSCTPGFVRIQEAAGTGHVPTLFISNMLFDTQFYFGSFSGQMRKSCLYGMGVAWYAATALGQVAGLLLGIDKGRVEGILHCVIDVRIECRRP